MGFAGEDDPTQRIVQVGNNYYPCTEDGWVAAHGGDSWAAQCFEEKILEGDVPEFIDHVCVLFVNDAADLPEEYWQYMLQQYAEFVRKMREVPVA